MAYRKLGLRGDHRRSVLRNSVTSLLDKEKIVTTETRAKEIRRMTDKMITLGRGGFARPQAAMSFLNSEAVVYKLFNDLAPRYEERQGGYTRIIKMVIVEEMAPHGCFGAGGVEEK